MALVRFTFHIRLIFIVYIKIFVNASLNGTKGSITRNSFCQRNLQRIKLFLMSLKSSPKWFVRPCTELYQNNKHNTRESVIIVMYTLGLFSDLRGLTYIKQLKVSDKITVGTSNN